MTIIKYIWNVNFIKTVIICEFAEDNYVYRYLWFVYIECDKLSLKDNLGGV